MKLNAKFNLVLAICATATLTSCGKPPVVEIDPSLQSYVDAFVAESAGYTENADPVVVNDLVVRYGKLDNPRAQGACEIGGGESPTIIINQEKWANLTENERESLMYHELGHCVLYRVHKDEIKEDGYPASLMSTYALNAEAYEQDREYYLQELFKNNRGEFFEKYGHSARTSAQFLLQLIEVISPSLGGF